MNECRRLTERKRNTEEICKIIPPAIQYVFDDNYAKLVMLSNLKIKENH